MFERCRKGGEVAGKGLGRQTRNGLTERYLLAEERKAKRVFRGRRSKESVFGAIR